jgi:hypothetical protein
MPSVIREKQIMGYQLWTSPITGYRRRGTRFESVKQLFMENITAQCIYEPLLSCPIDSESNQAKEALVLRDFDVAGVKENKDGPVLGYVVTKDIGENEFKNYLIPIAIDIVISDSTPVANIVNILNGNEFAFVIAGNQITGIITKADINKPPVRIYIFGIISLLEMHLNLWISHYFQNNSWTGEISEARLAMANEVYEIRKGNNQELSLLECLQFCDKKELLSKSEEFLKVFEIGKNAFQKFLKRAEDIRNELAHSQNSIISNLEWNKFYKTLSTAETFLLKSDVEIEKMARNGIDFQDSLI